MTLNRPTPDAARRSIRLASGAIFWIAVVHAVVGLLAGLGLPFAALGGLTIPIGTCLGLLVYHAVTFETPALSIIAAGAIAALYGFLGIRLLQGSWAAVGLAISLYLADLLFLLPGLFSLGGAVSSGLILLMLGGLLIPRYLLIGMMIAGFKAFETDPGARKAKVVAMAIVTWPLRFLSFTLGR